MGIIKTFGEWLNEGYLSDRPDDNYEYLKDENCDVKNLYNYLIDHYEPLGDKTIEMNDGKDEDDIDWCTVQIPITLSGEHIITEIDAMDSSKIFAIDFTKGLKDYVLKTEYYEIDDENIDDDGYERVFFSNGAVLCSEVVDFLNELIELVPDPALKRL